MADSKAAFGEPWGTCCASKGRCQCLLIWSHELDRVVLHGDHEIEEVQGRDEAYRFILRAVACVNACAGMDDPEKEIAKLRASVA